MSGAAFPYYHHDYWSMNNQITTNIYIYQLLLGEDHQDRVVDQCVGPEYVEVGRFGMALLLEDQDVDEL